MMLQVRDVTKLTSKQVKRKEEDASNIVITVRETAGKSVYTVR